MESKFQQAIRTGLICGLVLAVIYLILSAASLWVNNTAAMKTYTDKAIEPFKDMWKDWPHVSQPVTYNPADMPQPPFEYYVGVMITLILWGIVFVGLLLTGAYAIKKMSEAKYRGSDIGAIGAVSGAAAFIPLLVAMFVISFVSIIWGSQATMVSTMLPPGFVAALPFFSAIGTCCCCLPVGIVVSMIVAAIGALGYALFTNRL
ncbi:MAG TPA: hypothetical protein VLT35_04735 [Methanocella sp.]|nr:hypothetical protein [Methanocella sp.]